MYAPTNFQDCFPILQNFAMDRVIGDTNFERLQDGVFVHRSAKLGRNIDFSGTVIVGPNTSIGAGAKIEDSLLESHAAVGASCVVHASWMWANSYLKNQSWSEYQLHDGVTKFDYRKPLTRPASDAQKTNVLGATGLRLAS